MNTIEATVLYISVTTPLFSVSNDKNSSTGFIISLPVISALTVIVIVALTLTVVFVFIFKGKKTIIL